MLAEPKRARNDLLIDQIRESEIDKRDDMFDGYLLIVITHGRGLDAM